MVLPPGISCAAVQPSRPTGRHQQPWTTAAGNGQPSNCPCQLHSCSCCRTKAPWTRACDAIALTNIRRLLLLLLLVVVVVVLLLLLRRPAR
jgi:hypothetical protein